MERTVKMIIFTVFFRESVGKESEKMCQILENDEDTKLRPSPDNYRPYHSQQITTNKTGQIVVNKLRTTNFF